MYILSDYSLSTFARRLGSKDKKKRERPGIRSGIVTGAKWGAGIGAGLKLGQIGANLATKNGRASYRTTLERLGRNPSIRKNLGVIGIGAGLTTARAAISGGLTGGLIGGGVNAVRKYQYDRDNAR